MFKKFVSSLFKKEQHERYLFITLLTLSIVGILLVFLSITEKVQNSSAPYYMYATSVMILMLIGILCLKIRRLWIERKKGMRGSKLHIQLVTLFALAAILPAITIGSFSGILFEMGVKSWFSKPVQEAVNQANEVAQSYLREHIRNIRTDALIITNALRPILNSLIESGDLNKVLTDVEQSRGLSEVLIFDKGSNIIGKSYLTFALELQKISMKDFWASQSGEVVIQQHTNYVNALTIIDPIRGYYLLIGKPISSDVLDYIKNTRTAGDEYASLLGRQSEVKRSFLILFICIVLLIITLAAWGGFWISNMLFVPISRLINAAHEVSQGNLDVTVKQERLNNDFDMLVHSFNHMTKHIKRQNEEIAISQRKAAWSDVARKIAHEIKNPLTPIHLSAERLKRKFKAQLPTSDQEKFSQYLDTISRHVDQIGNLVREFSDFARMPQAIRTPQNLTLIVNETISLQKQAFPEIKFEINTQVDQQDVEFSCDPQQISQLITNLAQNAIQAMMESKSPRYPMIMRVTITLSHQELCITIEDNGPGFPINQRDRMAEPYYTTREKGTGLGLAIVSTIVSDHKGSVSFEDSSLGGAKVVLIFNLNDDKSRKLT